MNSHLLSDIISSEFPLMVNQWTTNKGIHRFSLRILVAPKSQQVGSRASAVGGKVRFFSSPQKKAYAKEIMAEVAHLMPDNPLKGPVFLTYKFLLPRLKKSNAQSTEPAAVKPDFDNICKSVNDALTKAGLWEDDNQIFGAHIYKMRAEKHTPPRIELEVFYETERNPQAWL